MGRIRKTGADKPANGIKKWLIAIYIRLSREDGNDESESVVNQRKIIYAALDELFKDDAYEVIGEYVDDGTSGTTDVERKDFQRMAEDVRTGRVNCIVVKNLSRAFRNSANQGRFLEEFIPLYNTRFISLYGPKMDSYLDPEIVHSLEVGITGFMNEQYAYKTSMDVRRTLQHKKAKGEFIGAFAPYGYMKDPRDKNKLIIDEDAAATVRDVFAWFLNEGMSKSAVVRRLNDAAVPNPTAYKRAKGLKYRNPSAASGNGLWSFQTVARILADPIYIGMMRQGRQRVISYKVHKRAAIPESEWCVVENAAPPIIERETFDAVQRLLKRDTRTPPEQKEVYQFAGLVYCAECGRAMHRTSTKRGGSSMKYVYYVCRTFKEQSKQKCTKHSIRVDSLERAVLTAVQTQIGLADSLAGIIDEINNAPSIDRESARLNAMHRLKRKELDTAADRLDSAYEDWKNGDIDRGQYIRMKSRYDEQTERLRSELERIEAARRTVTEGVSKEDAYLATFLKCRNVKSLSRGLLVELVNAIRIHDDGTIDIQFNFDDQYRRIVEVSESSEKALRA